MRNATILVVRLKGVATEAIKNIVLAGIGKLVVLDPDDVAEEDLGAGFFFRDEDVGTKVRDTTASGPDSVWHAAHNGILQPEHEGRWLAACAAASTARLKARPTTLTAT